MEVVLVTSATRMLDNGLHDEKRPEEGPEINGDEPHDSSDFAAGSIKNVGSMECTSSASVADEVGKVCILSIDGGGMRGIIPGKILAYLENLLKEKSGDPNARIADYFDVAAGTSVGGIVTTMLFTDNGSGRPLFTGEDSWKLIAERGKQIFKIPASQRMWKKLRGVLSPRYSTKYLEGILKEYLIRDGKVLTLEDTLKSVLSPCYDLESPGPLVFSREVTSGVPLWEVCRATSAVPSYFKPILMKSMDVNKFHTGIDGGIVMNNPTAKAITHVLENKLEFPKVRGSQDLLVLSLGTGQFGQTYPFKKVQHWGALQWAKPVLKIILDGISDIVDQTVSMSFGEKNRCNYLRIQFSRPPNRKMTEMDGSQSNVKRLMETADDLLTNKSMEHLPFGGRRDLTVTNAERLDWFADQLLQEHKARPLRKTPTVILKNLSH